MNIRDPAGVMYFNCESGKKLPFRNEFQNFTITDPMEVLKGFQVAETKPEVHTIVVDTLTYLMDMYESVYVIPADDGRSAWQGYAQFFRQLMQSYVARSTKNVIFFAHLKDQLNETEMVNETFVPIKGATQNNGVESFFSVVLSSKRVSTDSLQPYQDMLALDTVTDHGLLNVTEDNLLDTYKHVFQTRNTVNERIRSPIGMWSRSETYIDNDIQNVLDRLNTHYHPQP